MECCNAFLSQTWALPCTSAISFLPERSVSLRDFRTPALTPCALRSTEKADMAPARKLEHSAVEPILGLIARGSELRRPAQDVCDDLTIVALHGLEKCLAGLRGRRKRCPSRLLSKPLASAAKRQPHKDRQRERRRSDAFR